MELSLLRKENLFGYLMKEILSVYGHWVTFCTHAYFLIQSYKQRQNHYDKVFLLSWLNYITFSLLLR